MLNGLDLFSGIGGISLALRGYVMPIAYCENNEYCQRVLRQRMVAGDLPLAPIWDNVQTLSCGELAQPVDILYAGFPCTDISTLGPKTGLDGERSGLVKESIRLAVECKAPWVFFENVPAIRTNGAEAICKELAKSGYDLRWCTLSAESVGALHKRNRWFLLGLSEVFYADRFSSLQANTLPITESGQRDTRERPPGLYWPFESRADWQESVMRICRGNDGVSNRVDRLHALGNSVVPQQARAAFKTLIGIQNHDR